MASPTLRCNARRSAADQETCPRSGFGEYITIIDHHGHHRCRLLLKSLLHAGLQHMMVLVVEGMAHFGDNDLKDAALSGVLSWDPEHRDLQSTVDGRSPAPHNIY